MAWYAKAHPGAVHLRAAVNATESAAVQREAVHAFFRTLVQAAPDPMARAA